MAETINQPFYKQWKYQLVLIGITIIFGALAYVYAPEVLLFFWGLVKASTAIMLWVAFDKYVLKDIDTITEIKNGNIAYAIFLLAIAILINAGINAI
jgi:hypothetical protein